MVLLVPVIWNVYIRGTGKDRIVPNAAAGGDTAPTPAQLPSRGTDKIRRPGRIRCHARVGFEIIVKADRLGPIADLTAKPRKYCWCHH